MAVPNKESIKQTMTDFFAAAKDYGEGDTLSEPSPVYDLLLNMEYALYCLVPCIPL